MTTAEDFGPILDSSFPGIRSQIPLFCSIFELSKEFNGRNSTGMSLGARDSFVPLFLTRKLGMNDLGDGARRTRSMTGCWGYDVFGWADAIRLKNGGFLCLVGATGRFYSDLLPIYSRKALLNFFGSNIVIPKILVPRIPESSSFSIGNRINASIQVES